ncbi:13375_t:CDS:2 [Entrophospora sp. SA101]|nr:13375_t:CDS:2 [Entrophospora sp. SA101]
MPYLSIFKELLLALKEKNLVEELLVISSFQEGLKDYNKTNFHPEKIN